MNGFRGIFMKSLFVLSGIFLFTMVGIHTPTEAEAYTENVTFNFERVPYSEVCIGISAQNQSAPANMEPNGNSIMSRSTWNYGWYHFNWQAPLFERASSLADDLFSAPYSSEKAINSIALTIYGRVIYTGISGPGQVYAKFFDVDEALPCPSFEQGTLIAQTQPVDWPFGDNTDGQLILNSGEVNYTMLPGHRIRVELWVDVSKLSGQFFILWYGGTGTTKLEVTQSSDDATTVGPGIDPPASTIGPGGTAADLDAFTLQTSSGFDTLGGVTVTLTPAGAYNYVGSVAVTSDDGTITYGSVSNPSSDEVSIPFSTLISASAVPVQYKVRIAARPHYAFPPPPGELYNVQGVVTGIYSMNTKIYNDATDTSVTIDNLSPDNPDVSVAYTECENNITFNWTPPGDDDYSEVLILRSTTPVLDSPTEGLEYSQGDTIGSSTVIFVGSLETFTYSGLPWRSSYYYKIFAKDNRGNYSTGATIGPYTLDVRVALENGADPSDKTISSASSVMLDSFSLQTFCAPLNVTTGVSSVTVGLAAGASAYLSKIEITDESGGQVYGAVANPASDNVTIPLASQHCYSVQGTQVCNDISYVEVSEAPTQYRVRVTPKSYVDLPGPGAFTLTGTVTAFSAGYTLNDSYCQNYFPCHSPVQTDNDSSSATIIIDSVPLNDPTWGEIIPSDRYIALNWTNSTPDGQVLILQNTVPVADAPTQGTAYASGNMIGSSKVIFLGNGQSTMDNYVINGYGYYFKIFAKDANNSYSSGVVSGGPYIPGPVLTVSDGVNPPDAVIPPGAPPAMMDSFVIDASSSYGSPHFYADIVVSLAPGTSSALSLIEITSDDGSTEYGSVTNPATDTITVHLHNYLSLANQYKVRVTPKSHAYMPSPPGSSFSVSGVVTALLNSTHHVYNDASSATITIDNLSPGNPVWGAPEPGERQITLNWTNPTDSDFSRVIVLRNTTLITGKPVEGHSYSKGDAIGGSSVVFAGIGQSFTDTGLSGSVTYYYKIFAMDTSGNYSTGAASSPFQPIVVNSTTAGTAFASSGLRRITVSTPYLNDDNFNNSCQLDYKVSTDTSWTLWSTSSCDGEKIIQDLSSESTYDIRVTYQDPDGVIGDAEQIIGAVKPQSDKLIHNSRTTGSSYWSPMGWGIFGGMYGEFTCETCHMKNSSNISRIKEMIELEGLPFRPVVFWSKTGPNSYGDDTEPRFSPMTSRICEVCHTLTSGLQNTPMDDPPLFGPIHQYEQPEPANHFNANGTDNCTCCHTHETGFAIPQILNPNCSE